jgi:hypothetical protein
MPIPGTARDFSGRRTIRADSQENKIAANVCRPAPEDAWHLLPGTETLLPSGLPDGGFRVYPAAAAMFDV